MPVRSSADQSGAKSGQNQMTTQKSLPIKYRDFYDVPRAVAFEHRGATYLLDCPFDDEADEYGHSYCVYRLSSLQLDELDNMDWRELSKKGVVVGQLPVGNVEFDESKRRSIVVDSLGEILPS